MRLIEMLLQLALALEEAAPWPVTPATVVPGPPPASRVAGRRWG